MTIHFNKIRLYNFMSFGDSTIDLDYPGYTLVDGRNENPVDSARSNGSGKSTIWEGISWALTGTTIRGSKDIVNSFGNDGALVELDFNIDNNNYKIIRTKDHSKYKTNLKLFINDEDKSAKGIRDTEKILAEYLPDLTSSLIGSVIILGQGLPQRFTNNTPSGRKEVLEKLSKSDFMIADLKNRISSRKDEISKLISDNQISIATFNGNISSKKSELENTKARLDELNKQVDLDSQIDFAKTQEEELNNLITSETSNLDILKEEGSKLKSELDNIDNNKRIEIISVTEFSNNELNSVKSSKQAIESDIRNLEREIKKLDSISDVCPTCGQKLIGVEKPDTTNLKLELKELNDKLNNSNESINKLNESISNSKRSIEEKYNLEIKEKNSKLSSLREDYSNLSSKINGYISKYNSQHDLRLKLESQRDNLENNKIIYSNRINELEEEIIKYNSNIDTLNSERIILDNRLEIVNKMNTLITRDFRGYLLTNVIDFIDKKSKEYSKLVFNTDSIDFKLDGNNISISYDNKEYESLSGGEKQKIDLIVQFAIRDMLCKYLGFSSNILVLDEIADNVDSEGAEKLFNLISKKLLDVESIFIVSHHVLDIQIPYDRELTVVKGIDKISKII